MKTDIASLRHTASWTLSNLIRTSYPDSTMFLEAGVLGPVLYMITKREHAPQEVSDALNLLSILTINSQDKHYDEVLRIQYDLLNFLSNPDPAQLLNKFFVLRIFGNIILFASDIHCLFASDQFLVRVYECMTLEVAFGTPGFEMKGKLEREAAWLLSNIAITQHLYTIMSH